MESPSLCYGPSWKSGSCFSRWLSCYRPPLTLAWRTKMSVFRLPRGLTLYDWFIPGGADAEANPTWLCFPGNGGNLDYRVDELALAYHHVVANIFIFYYRGYGQSDGEPAEEGTYLDSWSAMQYLLAHADVNKGPNVLHGTFPGVRCVRGTGIVSASHGHSVGLALCFRARNGQVNTALPTCRMAGPQPATKRSAASSPRRPGRNSPHIPRPQTSRNGSGCWRGQHTTTLIKLPRSSIGE